MTRAPAADEAQVLYGLTADLDETALAAASAVLSAGERARADRFQNLLHRRDYVAAHALLRRTLSRWHPIDPADWTFEAGRGGKPEVSGLLAASTRLRFNLAHTAGLVACIVALDGEVGVDVESLDRAVDSLGVARRYFSPAELLRLEACAESERRERFVEIWTLKEAFLKATGTGITGSLAACSFDVDAGKRIAFTPPAGVDPSEWRFALWPFQIFRLAAAVHDVVPIRRAIVAEAIDLGTALA